MNEYKKKFRAIIYDLDYDALVSNSNKEIKSLISKLEDEFFGFIFPIVFGTMKSNNKKIIELILLGRVCKTTYHIKKIIRG